MIARKLMTLFCTLTCVALLALSVSCTTPAGRTAGEVVDDATITTKIKADLLADDDISSFGISVKTFQGEVVLTGAVESYAQRSKAERIARKVRGVTKIKNLIKVR
ncbi:MAG: BON domain-containing protein [Desulfobulbus sp.]